MELWSNFCRNAEAATLRYQEGHCRVVGTSPIAREWIVFFTRTWPETDFVYSIAPVCCVAQRSNLMCNNTVILMAESSLLLIDRLTDGDCASNDSFLLGCIALSGLDSATAAQLIDLYYTTLRTNAQCPTQPPASRPATRVAPWRKVRQRSRKRQSAQKRTQSSLQSRLQRLRLNQRIRKTRWLPPRPRSKSPSISTERLRERKKVTTRSTSVV
jgi:hypothetical protein